MIVGNYGSGKTEVAVNLALQLRAAGRPVAIADLDIVNPYFRCREARQLMEAHGIRVVVPPGDKSFADLPIVLPEIKGMLHPAAGELNLFDVGGDPVGAKVLSGFHEALGDSPYQLWQVINSRRPFTDTAAGCLKMQAGIEESSRLKVTGLVVNSHLIQETTPAVILEGYQLARQVSDKNGLPIRLVTAMGELAEAPELREVQAPLLRMTRTMLPPWIKRDQPDADPAPDAGRPPAGRAVPLGRRLGAK
jgi:hypothetical protein